MRYLGIDYGSKKIGLALSDEGGTMGFPHGVVPHTPALLETVSTLMQKQNVGGVVIGESLDFAGNDNPIAQSAHLFGNEIAKRSGKPVFYEDERLTSAEARRAETNAVDASAAALILTSFLSKPNHG